MPFINPVWKRWLHFFSIIALPATCILLLALCLGRAIHIEMYVVWRMMTEGAGLFFYISSITHVSNTISRRHSCGVLKEAWGSGKKSITSHSSGSTHLSFYLVLSWEPCNTCRKSSRGGSKSSYKRFSPPCGSHSFVLRVYRLSTLKEMSLLGYSRWKLWEHTLIVHCTLSPLRLIVHDYF